MRPARAGMSELQPPIVLPRKSGRWIAAWHSILGEGLSYADCPARQDFDEPFRACFAARRARATSAWTKWAARRLTHDPPSRRRFPTTRQGPP